MPIDNGIRLELATRLTPDAVVDIGALVSHLGLGSEPWPARLRSRLTLARDARRLDLLAQGPLGGNVTFASSPAGAYWIQHDAQVYVPLESRDLHRAQSNARAAKSGAKAANESVATAQRRTDKRRESAQLTAHLNDPLSGRTVRLTVRTNPEWRAPALAHAALAALIGGPEGELPPGIDVESWVRELAEGGLPALLQVEVLDGAGKANLLAETKVTAFAALPLESSEFAPPKGYRKWRLNEKTRAKRGAKPGTGFTAMAPHPFSAESEGSVSQRARDNGDGPGREVPDDPMPPPPPPRPRVTSRPRIGLRIEQRLLDHLAMLFNSAVTPLRSVAIGQGVVNFDWLDELRADVARRGAGAPGTAIFEMLHDVALPTTRVSPPPPASTDFNVFNCRGLLDQVAIRDAEQRFRAGTYPQSTVMSLPPSMRTVIGVAGRDWDRLPDGVKARLAFELVRREYGVIRFPFPTGTAPDEPALGLVHFQATDIAGTLTLPRAPAPAAGDPPFNPLLTLTAGFGGTISGALSLGSLSLGATIARWPTASFWLLLAGAVVVAIVVPSLAWALGLAAGLALFLAADVVRASLTATGLSAALSIRFVPDARGVFVPVTTCTLDGAVSFGWASQVPTGIHQILAAIEQALLNGFRGSILAALADGIAAEVNGAVHGMIGEGFPATALRIGLPISGGTRGGRSGQYTYLEAELDPATDPRFPAPSVAAPAFLEGAQAADAARAAPGMQADHYGSLSFDENFLNATLTGMRLRRLFDGAWDRAATRPLRPLMPAPLPSARVNRMLLTAESGPSMTLAAGAAPAPNGHGTVAFAYVLTLQAFDRTPVATIRFRVDTTGQLVLGSAVAPGDSRGTVRIQTLPDRAFDLLVPITGAAITPVSFDLITIQETRTVTIEYDSGGKPHQLVEVDRIETATPVPLSPGMAQALAPLLRRTVTDVWWARGLYRAPRRDGIRPGTAAPGPVDPVTTFRYPLGDMDPDALADEPHARVELGLDRRLAHFHLGHGGLAATALLEPRAGSLIPVLASLNGSNWARTILAGLTVKASSTSDRDLAL